MTISHQRLDRFLNKNHQLNRHNVKVMLAQKRVMVDGEIVTSGDHIVHKFSHICLDDKTLQQNKPIYLMLHKPVGVVSSTKGGNFDERLRKQNPNQLHEHATVIDLLTHPQKSELHIVGRLDLNTSGLVLLTNDSRWSSLLTLPDSKVEKRYRVLLQNPITAEYISAFAEGMYFSKENITTRPAKLRIIAEYIAEVILTEGRYHQIKRMFGRFQNPVIGLHREAIGQLVLDDTLKVGESRALSAIEFNNIHL